MHTGRQEVQSIPEAVVPACLAAKAACRLGRAKMLEHRFITLQRLPRPVATNQVAAAVFAGIPLQTTDGIAGRGSAHQPVACGKHLRHFFFNELFAAISGTHSPVGGGRGVCYFISSTQNGRAPESGLLARDVARHRVHAGQLRVRRSIGDSFHPALPAPD